MVTDEPREGRQLPGAQTSEEERAGTEQVLIHLMDGVVEAEHRVAPAGDVRLVVMNQGTKPYGFTMAAAAGAAKERSGDGRQAVADWQQIGPGDSGEALLDLQEGDYELTSLDTDGRVLSTATLIVQPQQGLPGSEDLRRAQPGA